MIMSGGVAGPSGGAMTHGLEGPGFMTGRGMPCNFNSTSGWGGAEISASEPWRGREHLLRRAEDVIKDWRQHRLFRINRLKGCHQKERICLNDYGKD